MLAKFLFSAILSLLLVSTRTAALNFDVGKITCKSLAYSMTLSTSEFLVGTDVTLKLYKDQAYAEIIDTTKISISDHFSSTDLFLSGEFEFAKKFTKSNPQAVLEVSVVDDTGVPLVLTATDEDDTQYILTPIKCENNVAAIAGGVVGGVAALALIAAVIFVVRRKKQQRKSAGGVLENAVTSTQPTLPFSPQLGVQPLGSPDEKYMASPVLSQTSVRPHSQAGTFMVPQQVPVSAAAPQQFSPIFQQQPMVYHSQ